MKIAGTIPTIRYPGLALLLAVLLLPGCVSTEMNGVNAPCTRNCVVTIIVPRDPGEPPRVDKETFKLKAGSVLEFDVKLEEGVDPQSVNLAIRFEKDAFELPNGKPAKSLPVKPGKNAFRSRPFSHRQCPDKDRCKYDVVDTGPGQRTPLDPWIIIDR